MNPRTKTKTYSVDQCALYKVTSKKRLAKLLFSSPQKIKKLALADDLYFEFTRTNERTGKSREIVAPREDLKAVQKRVAALLQRISPPSYLFSPVKGRSYVDNAYAHRQAGSIRLLDLADFYPNCSANKIKWYFRRQLCCSEDVAALLRDIACFKGALPQGSPCSPILAYLAYVDMWNEIDSLVSASGCTMSVYVDDITISGRMVPERLIWSIKQVIRKHGHTINTTKERSKVLRAAEVTGVVVHKNRLLPPNRQREKLAAVVADHAEVANDSPESKKLRSSIRSRRSQISQVLQRNRS